jgi:hypothetical protein
MMHDVVGWSPNYKKRKRDIEIRKKKKRGTHYQMIEGAHGKKRIKNCT